MGIGSAARHVCGAGFAHSRTRARAAKAIVDGSKELFENTILSKTQFLRGSLRAALCEFDTYACDISQWRASLQGAVVGQNENHAPSVTDGTLSQSFGALP